ncbi:hypothetical protein [Tateyamaria sp. Alg231-49]|uniref:hypothetical protein n=1 Tax=Tateyamaria sp. Alg231-49 TaxID=1922219 RepID=UPI001F416E14|nr:hypothetical protein [Tateyamaria sp. Alg231-49]
MRQLIDAIAALEDAKGNIFEDLDAAGFDVSSKLNVLADITGAMVSSLRAIVDDNKTIERPT